MAKKGYDPDEVFALNTEPEDVLEALLRGAGTADEDWEMDTEGSEEE
jgi:hypothetical protein